MTPALLAVAVVVAGGAVLAVSAREPRAALVGLALALGLGPFLAEPLPDPAVLGARVVTGVLVAYLLRSVIAGASTTGGRDGRPGRPERPEIGSRLGWPAETLLALGGVVAGLALIGSLAGLVPRGGGGGDVDLLSAEALALAAGLASIVIALAPAFLARGSLRTAIGLLVLVQGIVLARTGIAGAPGELEQLGVNGLVLAIGAGGALLVAIEARGSGPGEAGGTPAADLPVATADSGSTAAAASGSASRVTR